MNPFQVSLSLVLLVGGGIGLRLRTESREPVPPQSDPVIVEIGECRISRRDVALRESVARVYYPSESRPLGLDQLVRACNRLEVLRRHGRVVTREMLKTEAERIQQQTRAVEKLARIQAVFGEDHDAYLRNYVMPLYVDRVLYYDFFLPDAGAQESSRGEAELLLQAGRLAPNRLCDIARRKGGQCVDFPAPDGWRRELLAGVEAGRMLSTLVEMEDSWLVARYLGGDRMEGVGIPKADYGKWLQREIEELTVVWKTSDR